MPTILARLMTIGLRCCVDYAMATISGAQLPRVSWHALEYAGRIPGYDQKTHIRHLGGTMARVPADQYFNPDDQGPFTIYAQVFDNQGNQLVTGQVVGRPDTIGQQFEVSVTSIYDAQPEP